MSNESSYTQGTKRAADKPVQVLRSPNSRAGRAVRRRSPTIEEQRQRDFERRYEGLCPGCGEVLDNLIVTDPHYGLIHELCARDFYNGRVDGDWWTPEGDV